MTTKRTPAHTFATPSTLRCAHTPCGPHTTTPYRGVGCGVRGVLAVLLSAFKSAHRTPRAHTYARGGDDLPQF